MNPMVTLFRVGERPFALGMESLRQILLTPRVYPLAQIRPGFAGVFLAGEGEVIPLLCLGEILRIEDAPPAAACSYTMVYGTDLGPVGLPVDQVLQMVEGRRGTLAAATDTEPPANAWSHEFSFGGETYPLLDIESLLMSLPR